MTGAAAHRRATPYRSLAATLAIQFAANDDRVSYVGTMPDPAAGITITGWVRRLGSTPFATFFRLFGTSTTITCATGATGTLGPGYYTGGGSLEIPSEMVVATWYPIATTRLGTTGAMYRGGPDLVGATTVVTGTVGGDATPTGITIGGRGPSDPGDPFTGDAAYFRAWSTRLDQAQVEAEWASRTPVITGGLHADWRLQGVSDLADHFGSRHLTAGANPVVTVAGPPI